VLVKQATVQPPPLLALRPDVPRSLSLAVHTLLAKNPAHRPASAAEARRILERSVAPYDRAADEAEREPFASTVAVLNAGRYAFTRVATLFAILAMAFTAVVAWSASAGQRGALEEAARDPTATASALLPRATRTTPTRAASPALTRDAAWRIAASLTRGRLADARVVGTSAGPVIAAVGSDPTDGTINLYVIEQRGSRNSYAVALRVPLDVEGFRGGEWTEEVSDLDGDGYDEVLCTGRDARDGATESRRYVVYAPRTRETYSLHLAPDSTRAHALRATWSPSAQGWDARLFRYALRQRALN